jgi:hypothetical protein
VNSSNRKAKERRNSRRRSDCNVYVLFTINSNNRDMKQTIAVGVIKEVERKNHAGSTTNSAAKAANK